MCASCATHLTDPGELLDAQGSAEQLSNIWGVVGMSGRHRPCGLLSVQLVGVAIPPTSLKRFVARKTNRAFEYLIS